ncbi:NAD-dependent epimerase/dehydratase family protein [Kaistia granuli]|uniref:NAD-dependent epimerase/dehydratase family protein n=1 Tax=Kaistia granuli TaxID=363259 RepID=UPI00035EEA4D|nr:NAD(P)-dependent oxidoreductase [Kaistia granuli]
MSASSPRDRAVLVTGAAGFIGQVVTRDLAAAGFAVRAGTRRNAAPLPEGAVAMRCDLADPAATRAAVAGTSVVVHAAYGDSASMVAECRVLLAAMSAAKVPCLIYFSSIAVYGERTGVVDETMPAAGAPGGYGDAKIACEAFVRAWAQDPAAPERRVLILRPGIVYGTGSVFWTDKLAERIRARAWGHFGPSGAGPAALVHVDDIGELVATAARWLALVPSEWPPVTALNVVGPETPSWNDYFAALAKRIGVPLRPLGGVRLSLRQALAVPGKVARKLRLPLFRRAALAPTRPEMAIFARDVRYDTTAIRARGLAPRTGLAEGLARTTFKPTR